MADSKISQLGAASAVQSDDLFVIARSGANYKATHAQLMAQYNRLFGTAKPADDYQFTYRTFQTNDFTNHRAGFEDSQSSPYSFGGSPGGFSLSVGGRSAESTSVPHFLTLYNNSGTDTSSLYLQWTDSTAKSSCDILGGISPFLTSSDTLVAELRVWGVQSPGASDAYWAVRWDWLGSTRPQFPLCTGLFYGTGTTVPDTSATLVGSRGPIVPGLVYKVGLSVTASPAAFLSLYTAEGVKAFGVSTSAAGASSIKTARLYLYYRYSQASLDQVIIS